MLLNLRAILKPETLADAQTQCAQAGVYPLYGGGAYLLRASARQAEAVVDLNGLLDAGCIADVGGFMVGPCATLHTLAEADPNFNQIIRDEYVLTLRNTLTLGDVLMESLPDSLLMALLVALDGQVTLVDGRQLSMAAWFALEGRQQTIIKEVYLPNYQAKSVAVVFRKVARTPADAPIVGMIGVARQRAGAEVPEAFAVVVGLAAYPVHYAANMPSRRDDYRGSNEYRAAMAHVLSSQTTTAALERFRNLIR
jgi:CO/xanthine dehydrogenase FAD-binding subunit